MDKNFNDQELSDIMKEIEALEDGLQKENSKNTEVFQELVEMKESEAIPLRPHAASAPVAHHHTPAGSTCMSFKVQGELTLDLNFEVGGKVVEMKVTETGLSIVVDGGMTFTVPLKEKKVA